MLSVEYGAARPVPTSKGPTPVVSDWQALADFFGRLIQSQGLTASPSNSGRFTKTTPQLVHCHGVCEGRARPLNT